MAIGGQHLMASFLIASIRQQVMYGLIYQRQLLLMWIVPLKQRMMPLPMGHGHA
jgi:hypothetical protein